MSRHLLVIGAQRCGTTYLHSLLDAHPQITMARPSPSRAQGLPVRRRAGGLGADGTGQPTSPTPTTEQLLGEKSTSYIEDPRRRAHGHARCSVEPERRRACCATRCTGGVELAVQHRQRARDAAARAGAAREPRVGDAGLGPAATSVSPFAYLERGRYVDLPRRLVRGVPDTMHVLLLAELLDDRHARSIRCSSAGCRPGASSPDRRERPSTRARSRRRRCPASCSSSCSDYFAASNAALSRRLGRRAAVVRDPDPEQYTSDRPHMPDLPRIPFNQAAIVGRELEYVQQSHRGWPPGVRRRVRRARGGPARRGHRRRRGAAHHLVHLGPRAVRDAPRPRPERHGHRAVVHLHHAPRWPSPGRARGWSSATSSRDTLGLDPEHLATLLDDTVRAVVVVHYAGVACDIDGHPRVLAEWPDVALVEDNAHGLFGTLARRAARQPRPLRRPELPRDQELRLRRGRRAAAQRGADVDRARVLYDKGTNRRAFLLGQVDKYTWKDTGSSFGLADVLAAYLLAQLEQRDVVQAKRRSDPRAVRPRCSPRTPRTPRLHASRTCRRTGRRRTTCSTCCCRTASAQRASSASMREAGRPGHLPLRAAAQLGRRPDVRGAADRVPGHRGHQRPAAAAALLQRPERRRPGPGGVDLPVVGLRRRAVSRRAARMCQPRSQPGSSSLHQPDYWWYRARTELLETVLEPYLGTPDRLLDVGSADGPSVGWMRGDRHASPSTCSPTASRPVRASAAPPPRCRSPTPASTWSPPSTWSSTARTRRWRGRGARPGARPGGRLLLSVPAYEWAWSDHDVRAGHHRRYTRPRLVRVVEATPGCTSSGRRTPSARCSRSSSPSGWCAGSSSAPDGRRSPGSRRSPARSTGC